MFLNFNLFSPIENRLAPEHITDRGFLELELQRWKVSKERQLQLTGERYYIGDHDILNNKRLAIGESGLLEEVHNLPNNRLIDNQFCKAVDQKANYLLSKPVTFETGNDADDVLLKDVFNDRFLNRLKNIGVDSLCGGIAWLYVYYDEAGKLAFQRFKPYEVLPFWKDNEHTELECAVRLYQIEGFEGFFPKTYEKVEVFTKNGILRYDYSNGALTEDTEKPHDYYFYINDKGYVWDTIPLIPFKYNSHEIPLIKRVKSLQDALNLMRSELINRMQEDSRNTILIIKNYDGQNLGEFRQNLATYGAVKVRNGDGENGGVESLQIEVNAQNYDLVFNTLKKAIIENAMCYDAKDDRIGSNANMLNIKSMYSDIDLDADNMENEFKQSFEKLMFFVNAYLGKELHPKITFNRDMLINETEVIDNLVKLGVQLPNKLLVGQVPFVDDVTEVMNMLEKERQEDALYNMPFDQDNKGNKPHDPLFKPA